MEAIKKYLDERCSDESQIRDFLETNGEEIKHFFVELWERQFSKPVEDVPQTETQQAEDSEQTVEHKAEQPVEIQPNQQEEDMKKFGAENQADKEQAKQEALAFQIKNKQITFPNGKVNQEYSVDFDFEKLEIPEIAEVSFEGLEAIGLQYLPEEKKIKGVPTQAGDHKIEMKFKRNDWEEGKPLLTREVMFIINPDPRVLWSKNIPTPEESTEYYKPDSDKAFEKIDPKSMVAASQRGRSHAIEGKPRDDDFTLYFDKETEWYVIVVADGAGSAPFSRRGSQTACETVKDVCSKQLAKDGISEVLELAISDYQKDSSEKNRADLYKSLHSEILAKAAWEAYNNINKEASEKQRIAKEYATTLLISICKKFDFGWFVGAFWVGDGGIGIYRQEPPELKILGEPDGGEFAGQTRFLTMPEIFSDRVRTRFEIVEDFTAVILMSDGVTDPKFETDANLNRIEKWNELWNDLNGKNEDNAKVDFSDNSEQSAAQLLKWLDFWSKGNHDDRTIAILF